MAMIEVPRPQKGSMNPNRAANALLLSQVEHMHAAEKRLPERFRTDTYVNAIRTEREAAQYIQAVTSAIHRAHDEAARKRADDAKPRRAALHLAAAAEEPTAPKPAKKKPAKSRRKK